MEMTTCRRCHRYFNYSSGDRICTVCKKELEEVFLGAKEYIRENPRVGVKELSEAKGIPVAQIERWIRQERLEFSKDSATKIACEHCGAPILTGRFCTECKKKLVGGFVSADEQKEDKASQKTGVSNGMRFIRGR